MQRGRQQKKGKVDSCGFAQISVKKSISFERCILRKNWHVISDSILNSKFMNTILEVVEKQLETNCKGTVFTFLTDGETAGQSVSLSEIQKGALKISRLLLKQSSVLILLPQSISFIKAFLGCLYGQSLAVPIAVPTKNRGIEKLKAIIADAKVSICITNQSTLANLQKWFGESALLNKIKWLLVEDFEKDSSVGFSSVELPKPHQVAFLQYTSGSTDKPKAVMVTHENIIANSKIIQKCFQNNNESVSVCWLPSYHDMGLIDGIIQPLFSGFHSVMMSPAHFLHKPVRWFKAITKYRATYSGAPNFAFDLCCDRIREDELSGIDLSSLRCLYNGSEPIRPRTIRKFTDKFSAVGFSKEKLFTCYGLAEATLAVTTSRLGDKPVVIKVDPESFGQNEILLTGKEPFVELVGCGYVNCDTDLIIVNPDSLKECEEKEIGEIWVAGKSVTAGYLNKSEETNETFVLYDGKRFLRTGDLGFLLNGELFITGRIKDVIIIRGKNHYPQDIEQTASLSHHALQTNGSAAFSVEVNQEEKLVIVQEVKRSFLRKIDYEDVFSCIMTELSQRHEVSPHDIALTLPNTIPKTTSGKIQRNVCRNLWNSQKLDSLAFMRDCLSYK